MRLLYTASDMSRSLVLFCAVFSYGFYSVPLYGATKNEEKPQKSSQSSKTIEAKKVETLKIHTNSLVNSPGGGLITLLHDMQVKSVVNRAYIDIQAPTSTAFQLISMTPGANVSNSDPFGISPQVNISVRGLNGDEIGYVLEGMPMNDLAYYGGYPSQFADSENYSTVGLQQGSADLDSPVLNAAGGLMSMTYRNPLLQRGGYASFSYGSYNTRRGFIRLETGEIGKTGIRGFISYSNSRADNWRGAGHDTRQHVDFKFLKEWGDHNSASLLGSWNLADTSYYPKVSLSQWDAKGIHANNLAKHYNPNDAQGGTDYWRLWRDPEETFYIGAPVHLTLTDHIFLTATPYAQRAYGNGPSGSTLSTTGNYLGTEPLTQPLSLPYADQDGNAVVRADYTQKSYRAGLNTALHFLHNIGKKTNNEVILGYWYDYTDDNEQNPFTSVDPSGYAPNIWGNKKHDRVLMSDGNRFLGESIHTMSQVNALYIADKLSLFNNRLNIEAGFKEVMLSRWGNNDMPGNQHHVSQNSAEPLPRFGLRWAVTPKDEIFLNGTTNFRAPAVTTYYDAYSLTSPDLASVGAPNVKNEYSISEEIGYRRNGDWLTGTISFFNYNFTNRQVSTIVQRNNLMISSTINAGGQTSRGVDAELGLRPFPIGHFLGGKGSLSPYASFEYLHATIDNNLPVNGDYLPTKGKKSVQSPPVQAGMGLRYMLDFQDGGQFFSMITAHYTAHQYSTFMNDERIPSYMTADLSVGYHMGKTKYLNRPTFQLNFLNLSDQHYLSGVSTTQFNAHTTRGIHGTEIDGSKPKYRIGGGFAALFTASTGF